MSSTKKPVSFIILKTYLGLKLSNAVVAQSKAYFVNFSISLFIIARSGPVTMEQLLHYCLKKHRFTICLLGHDNEDIMDSCHFFAYLMTSYGHRPHSSFNFLS